MLTSTSLRIYIKKQIDIETESAEIVEIPPFLGNLAYLEILEKWQNLSTEHLKTPPNVCQQFYTTKENRALEWVKSAVIMFAVNA